MNSPLLFLVTPAEVLPPGPPSISVPGAAAIHASADWVADAVTAINTVGSSYPIDGLHPELAGAATVKNLAVVGAKSPSHYIVQVNFESPKLMPWSKGDNTVYISFQLATRSEPTDRDANNLTIINSAGDPFDPSIQREVSTVIITVIKWRTSYSASTALGYVNHTNSAGMTVAGIGTIAANTLRCLNYGPIDKIATDATRFQVAYQFEYDAGGFNHRLIDKGLRAWYTRTGESTKRLAHVMDMNRQPISAPILLKKGKPVYAAAYKADDGKFGDWCENDQLATGVTTEDPASGVGVIIKYPKYPTVDFAGLSL